MGRERSEMEKIYIVGTSGTGKTFLANKLSKKLKIRHYAIDDLITKKNSFDRVKESLRNKRIVALSKKKRWIAEGAYSSDWVSPIIKESDLVIHIEIKSLIAKKRILLRSMRRFFSKNEKNDKIKDLFDMMKLVDRTTKTRVLSRIKKLAKKHKKKVILLRNKKEVNEFLEKLLG